MNKRPKILEKLLEEYEVYDFSREWIEDRNKAESVIETNYKILKGYGLSDKKIASLAFLLALSPGTIIKNYKILSELGLNKNQIRTFAFLLSRNPESIQKNYDFLIKLGFSGKRITSNPNLLSRNPNSIRRNYKNLSRLGLNDDQIVSKGFLLALNPKTIRKNYEHHVGVFKKNYDEREYSRSLLINQAQLLGMPPITVMANIQYLNSMGIDYHKNLALLGTKPSTKRKKFAFILRRVFDYNKVPKEDKKKTIETAYAFIRDRPGLLLKSTKALERDLYKFKEKAQLYMV